MGVDLSPLIPVSTEDQVVPFEESDDPNKRAHIVEAGQNPHLGTPEMDAKDVVDIARMTNQVVIAICGHKFVPKHNPDNHELCKRCLKIKMGD